jgi:hypothetical protein
MAHSGAEEAQFIIWSSFWSCDGSFWSWGSSVYDLEVHFGAVMAHSGAEEAQCIIWRFILEL